MVEKLVDAYNGCQRTKHTHAAANGPNHAAAHNAAVHAAIHGAAYDAAVHAATHAAIHAAAHNATTSALYPWDLPVLYNSVTTWWQYVAVTNGSMCNGEFL